jgi:hypothetical protein
MSTSFAEKARFKMGVPFWNWAMMPSKAFSSVGQKNDGDTATKADPYLEH